MKEFEKESTIKKTVYEITKEELDEIKRVERNRGRQDIVSYLRFSIEHYTWKLNLKGQLNWLQECINFLHDKQGIISNWYNYSFHDYIRKEVNKK